jgi:hypothetical protein
MYGDYKSPEQQDARLILFMAILFMIALTIFTVVVANP